MMNDNSATAKELSLAIRGYGLLAAVSVIYVNELLLAIRGYGLLAAVSVIYANIGYRLIAYS